MNQLVKVKKTKQSIPVIVNKPVLVQPSYKTIEFDGEPAKLERQKREKEMETLYGKQVFL